MISEETFMRAHNLVSEWQGKENQNVPAHVIREIFNTHNEIFLDKPEYSTSCGGCRQRTWSRLKTWYHENKHLYGY
jgi:predicted thioredoxin/glutaredoxin